MRIADIMSREVVTLSRTDRLRDAIDLFYSRRIRHIPVVDGEVLVGIVTDRDVKRASPSLFTGIDREEYDRVLEVTSIEQVMTREPHTVTSSSEVKPTLRVMLEHRYGALPVVDEGRIVGIVTETDFLRAYFESLPD